MSKRVVSLSPVKIYSFEKIIKLTGLHARQNVTDSPKYVVPVCQLYNLTISHPQSKIKLFPNCLSHVCRPVFFCVCVRLFSQFWYHDNDNDDDAYCFEAGKILVWQWHDRQIRKTLIFPYGFLSFLLLLLLLLFWICVRDELQLWDYCVKFTCRCIVLHRVCQLGFCYGMYSTTIKLWRLMFKTVWQLSLQLLGTLETTPIIIVEDLNVSHNKCCIRLTLMGGT